jgi:phage gpG-like protein
MLNISFTATSVDKGLEEIFQRANALVGGARVKVGALGRRGRRGGGIDNVQLAIIHEFGTADGHIPERSFLRSTYEANRERYQGIMEAMALKVLRLEAEHAEHREVLEGMHAFGKGQQMLKRLREFNAEAQKDLENQLGLVGQQVVSDVKGRILEGEGIPPPNAPSTVRRKGSSRPLVDTGQLLNSLTYQVVPGVAGEEE